VELDVQGFGKIELSFYDKDAPKTVENFLRLVNAGFYDCLTFHRIAQGFVIQGGDPNGETDVPAGLKDVANVSAGYDYSLALLKDGTVVAWGDKNPTDATTGVAKVPAGLSGVAGISAGYYHNLVIKSDGSVVGWGTNQDGETTIPPGLTAVAVAAGGDFSLALKADGTVVGWGGNGSGQATYATPWLSVAGHSITAVYSGGNYPAATNTLTQMVNASHANTPTQRSYS